MKYIQTSLLFIPLVSFSLFSALSWADTPTQGARELSISGAGSSDKEFNDNAFAMEVSYGYYLSPATTFGVRQLASVTDSEGNNSNWNGATRFFYDYHLGQENLRPYLGINIGYLYGESVEDTFIAGPELGLKYYVLQSTFVVGQLEYQVLFEDTSDANDRFDDGAYIYSIGMGYNF